MRSVLSRLIWEVSCCALGMILKLRNGWGWSHWTVQGSLLSRAWRIFKKVRRLSFFQTKLMTQYSYNPHLMIAEINVLIKFKDSIHTRFLCRRGFRRFTEPRLRFDSQKTIFYSTTTGGTETSGNPSRFGLLGVNVFSSLVISLSLLSPKNFKEVNKTLMQELHWGRD